MFDRDAVWSLVGIGAACWTLGGAGKKWIRRLFWPCVASLVWFLFTHDCKSSLWCWCGVGLPTHLGYGEDSGGVQRVGVFCSYGILLMPLGVPWSFVWSIAAILTALFYASRRWNNLTWKWWELAAGALQGAALAWALMGRG